MSSAEVRISSTSEKIRAFVREAVKFVPVSEFLQLRFQRRIVDDKEESQLLDAADVVEKVAKTQGKTYILGNEINFSVDPRVIIARQIVAKISLPEYLAVRHQVLNAAIMCATRRRNEYELLGAVEVEKENGKLESRRADFNLTNKVIAAAKINLSSAV